MGWFCGRTDRAGEDLDREGFEFAQARCQSGASRSAADIPARIVLAGLRAGLQEHLSFGLGKGDLFQLDSFLDYPVKPVFSISLFMQLRQKRSAYRQVSGYWQRSGFAFADLQCLIPGRISVSLRFNDSIYLFF